MSVQNSSSSTSTNTLATQQHAWDVTGLIPDKPSNWDYGYVINRQMVGTTREQLIELFVKHGSAILLVGAFGLIGFAFIDNAGHLGGLVGGLLLGWLLLRRNGQRTKAQERLLQFSTLASLLALVVTAVYAVYRMFG